jgi:hypothetical protein
VRPVCPRWVSWRGWCVGVAELPVASDDGGRVEQLGLLEELKAAAAAAQARVTVVFADSQAQAQAEAGVRADRVGVRIGVQVALARRDAPHRGGHHVGMARALVEEMPYTYRALGQGVLTEFRAMLLVGETAVLSREDRAEVDRRLCGDPSRLAGWGTRRLVGEAKRWAYRLDPDAAVRRSRKAASERRVTIRPAPDTMTYLTGLLPVADGVAVHATLAQQADTLKAGGDPRSRGQIMADTLVGRVTGRDPAQAGPAVELCLVMTSASVFGTLHYPHADGTHGDGTRPDGCHGDGARDGGGRPEGVSGCAEQEPAWLHGYGPVPAWLGRRLLRDAEHRWIRRLYASPSTGELVALDSRRRFFTGTLAKALVLRDQTCRTPYCDAPVRHTDHIAAHAAGGATSLDNGQGLCEACNYAKQAPGWHARARAGPTGHTVTTTTPTGHTYRSHAPPLPGHTPPVSASPMEARFRQLLAA